ncbi:MAG: beta-methylgalactoside transporter [Lachnospiraceae bacterium]|nr:beta-methylgalactoside transporter [Lachnospiraceae bacterium]
MAMVLISGGMDLAAGRTVGVAVVITGSLGQMADYSNKFFPDLPQLPFWVPLLVAIVVCFLFGLLNGVSVAYFSIPPFIVTLATGMIIWGINLLYYDMEPNNSQPIGGIQEGIKYFGSGYIAGTVPVIIVIAIVVVLISWYIMKYTSFGRNIYAIGGNRDAAEVCGIKVKQVLVWTYAIAAITFAIAGYLECARTNGATASYGDGYEFDAIAACVVGGVSNSGGVGTIPGMALGVLMFGIINYGLTFLGVQTYWQKIVKGIIILTAVGFDVRKNIQKK